MGLNDDYSRKEYDKFDVASDGRPVVRTKLVGASFDNLDVTNNNVDTSGYLGKDSGTNADFTTAYASAITITLSGFPTSVAAFTADDIVSVVQIATDGSVTKTYTRNDAAFTLAANVLTVVGAAFVASDSFVIYTNVPRAESETAVESLADTVGTHGSAAPSNNILAGAVYNQNQVEVGDGNSTNLQSNIKGNLKGAAYDDTLGGDKNFPQANAPKLATSPQAYTVLTATTVAYVEGAVIDTRAYSDILFHYSKTASDADNSYLKVVTLTSAAGAVDYQTTTTDTTTGVSVISPHVYERDKAALVECIVIPTNGANFMRFDLAKVADTGTDSVWTPFITKVPR